MAKFLSHLPIFRVAAAAASPSPRPASDPAAPATPEKPVIKEAAGLPPLDWWGKLILSAFLLFFAYLFVRMVFPNNPSQAVSPEAAGQNVFIRMVNAVSVLAIPFLLSAIPLFAMLRRVKVYEEFVDGAKEGFEVAIRIIPYLVAMLVAIGMFRAAGGIDLLSKALSPFLNAVGFPPDLAPMVLVRPLSGSGSLGFFTDLVRQFGPDSLIARMAGTIYGSTETTFYVLAVYFGSVAVTRTRHAVLAGLTADLMGVIAAVIVCRIVFG
jgi:spore maturation protein B